MQLATIQNVFTIEQIGEAVDTRFPFRKEDGTPSYNPGQKEAIVNTINAFLNKDKTHVVLEAPTGIGKSVISRTIHYAISDLLRSRSHEIFRTTIHTTTIGLQEQYVREDDKIYSLKGKRNYSCACPISSANCVYGSNECRQLVQDGDCNPKKECPYLIRRERWAKTAPFRVTNSAMIVTLPINLCGQQGTRSALMVIDEAHKMKNTLREHCKMSFLLRGINKHVQKGAPNAKVIQQEMLDLVSYCYDKYNKGDFVKTDDTIIQMVNNIAENAGEALTLMQKMIAKKLPPKYLVTINEAIDFYQQLTSSCQIVMFTSEFVMDEIDENQMVLKPIFAKDVVEMALYSRSDYFLHMSATICGTEKYIEDMGIPKEMAEVIVIDNPIPLESRLIHYLPVGKLNAKAGPEVYKALISGIDEIIENHKNENGLIHTVSYKLAEYIKRESKYGHLIHIGRDRKETMALLEASAKAGTQRIIASPSMLEGYDLKNELGRFCIIAKIPYPFLGDPLISYVCKKDPGSYAQETVLGTVQAAGRCVRGVNDYAQTYILDGGFSHLFSSGNEYMPQWFKDSVQIYE